MPTSATRLLLLLACVLLIPVSASAQASLTGTVRDASGGVLPGVTVEASSPALIEKVRTTTTDASGQYRIVDLRPGVYALSFTLPGFTTVRREGLELAGSATLTIPVDMKVGGLQETITVSGETPVVDVQNTRRENVLGADILAAMPATRAYGSLLNAVPGLTVTDAGLAATPTMTFFAAHGGNINEGRMQINGMTVAAAFNGGGVSSLTYDTTNADEVSVLVSGGLGETETGGPSMNIVPRSGGNRFGGQAFLNHAGEWSKGDNLDDELRAVGITESPGIISAYDASASLGGPIKRDRIWFFGSYRDYMTAQAVEGIHANRFAGDPSRWDYALDDDVTARNVQGRHIWTARLTAQVTAANRVMVSHEHQARCEGSTLTPRGDGCRQRGDDWIALGSASTSPEANTGYFDFPYDVTQATWTSPVTSRLLMEAGFTRFAYNHAGGPGQLPPDGVFDLIPVTEQRAIDGHRANFTYRGLSTYSDNFGNPNNWRASVSYVTGAHNMKVGYQGSYLVDDRLRVNSPSGLAYRTSNGVPNAVTYRYDEWTSANRTGVAALYVQDTWTRSRLSLQGALRYDRAWSWSPAEGNGTNATSMFLAAPIAFERTVSVSGYNDLSPRFGAAYDVFGNGRTAIKFNIGRYLAPATNDTNYAVNNPANRMVTQVSNRGWTDGNGNWVVDCDLVDPAQNSAGGDTCAALTGGNLNFGKSVVTTEVNPDLLHGWGVRPVDWQWGLTLQQEIVPRVSAEVSYNRRWWGNFYVTDNLNRDPSQYDAWTITAPSDSRLPGGGGYPITLYTPTDAAAAIASRNYVTFESDFGPARKRYWQGVDFTLNARLRNGLTVQGGTSTGRTVEDTCATEPLIDSPDTRNCHSVEPFQTTLRGLASYTLPKIDVLISATMRSQPGLPLAASYQVPNSVVSQQLGRLPRGSLANGTTTIALLDDNDHRLYADNRRTQIDMRFAKVLRFGRTRADIGLDLGNLLNTNYATRYEGTYDFFDANGGTWLDPTAVYTPRFVRLNFTVNY